MGVGAVLSQQSYMDQKLHPCAFFSRRISAAERNYDVSNRELLAVKLTLEEWKHWLEGASQPFLVGTDHKNLEYIQTPKRLHSQQARWALFFNRYNFTLPYRPGSKPDALSRRFGDTPCHDEPILPASCLIAAPSPSSLPVLSVPKISPPAKLHPIFCNHCQSHITLGPIAPLTVTGHLRTVMPPF